MQFLRRFGPPFFIFHSIIFIQVKGSYKYVFQPDLFKTKKEINTSSNKINLLTNIIYNIYN